MDLENSTSVVSAQVRTVFKHNIPLQKDKSRGKMGNSFDAFNDEVDYVQRNLLKVRYTRKPMLCSSCSVPERLNTQLG